MKWLLSERKARAMETWTAQDYRLWWGILLLLFGLPSLAIGFGIIYHLAHIVKMLDSILRLLVMGQRP